MRSNLINARKEAQYTQLELAKQLKLSVRQYQALEAGTSNGSIGIWQQLKQLLLAPSIDHLLEQVISIHVPTKGHDK